MIKSHFDSFIESITVYCLFEIILTVVTAVFHRTVLYECCPGYMKLEGMHGCPAGMLHKEQQCGDILQLSSSCGTTLNSFYLHTLKTAIY